MLYTVHVLRIMVVNVKITSRGGPKTVMGSTGSILGKLQSSHPETKFQVFHETPHAFATLLPACVGYPTVVRLAK
jgi:hypothetical protein